MPPKACKDNNAKGMNGYGDVPIKLFTKRTSRPGCYPCLPWANLQLSDGVRIFPEAHPTVEPTFFLLREASEPQSSHL